MNMWTEKEAKIVSDLLEKDKLYKEISKVLISKGFDRSTEAVRKFTYRNFERLEEFSEEEIEELTPQIEEKFQITLDKIRKLRDRLVKITSDKFVKTGRSVKATKKVLVISDLHIPFENPDIIEKALKDHGDADILVVNGDILDHFAVSKWPKQRTILLKWEYEIAIEWIKLFSKMFKKVILTSGNHEFRLQRYFSANIDPAISFLISPDILERLAKGYDFNKEGILVKTHNFKNVHYESGLLNWYTVIGKCIFVHPRASSGIPMRTAIKAADHFLDREDYQCLVCAHSHKFGQVIWRNKLLIEQGCCCVPMDYEAEGSLKFSPQTFGYAVVYMDRKGNVDFNRSKGIYYGSGTSIKIEDALRLLK